MKKNLIAAFAVCFAASLISCNSASQTQEQAAATDTVETVDSLSPQESDNEAQATEQNVVKVFTNDDKAVATDKPLVIDFSATWCGPCQRFKPTFHQVAEEYASRATFATADVDECTQLASQYKIESIPFVLIINPDGTSASQMGLMTEKEFKNFLDKNLK